MSSYQKMMNTINKMPSVEEIQSRLSPLLKEDGLDLVLLFGSAVSGKMHKRSDIDLAFLFDRQVDIVGLTNSVIKALRTDKVDVVDLRRASPLLKYSVAGNCRVIYERREGLFIEFYSLAFRMYVDSRKLRDAGRLAINSYLQAKGLS